MIGGVRLLGTILYWLAVVAISVVLVILLILFLSRATRRTSTRRHRSPALAA